jgi:hypothetical protein
VNLGRNVWRIGHINPAGATSSGINTFGSNDVFDVGAITNNQGTLQHGVVLQAGSTGNNARVGLISGQTGQAVNIASNCATNIVTYNGNQNSLCATFSTPGSALLPGGLIFKWGQISVNATAGAAVSFSPVFPTNAFGCQVTQSGGVTPNLASPAFTGLTTSGVTINNNHSTTQLLNWQCYGN